MLLTDVLFPKEFGLKLEQLQIQDQRIELMASSTKQTATCPQCQGTAQRIHSWYQRKPADLPIAEYQVRLLVRVQRFFCDTLGCMATTFAERLPGFLEPYARRTNRLMNQQQQVAFRVNGKEGSRLLDSMQMPLSHDSLVRFVRNAPEPETGTPSVLGLDDWAQRRGQTYGTILVDLETHTVVDVLPDRTAESVAQWLREHPGVEVISRDRGQEYIQGATEGAPEATQVADRWHLLKNLREALERLLEEKPESLKAAANKPVAEPTENTEQAPVTSVPPEESAPPEESPPAEDASSEGAASTQQTQEQRLRQARLDRRMARYQRVKELAAEGISHREIARRTGLDRRTVAKYARAPSCPSIPPRGQNTSKVAPYREQVDQWIEEGCSNMATLLGQLQQLGFDGSYSSVRRWVQQAHPCFTATRQPRAAKDIVPWSSRRGSWVLTRPEEELTQKEQQALERMRQSDEQVSAAHKLAQRFVAMVTHRQPDALDPWLEDASQSGIKAFKNLAKSLRGDLDAVRNALSLPWSQGQVEGQVNRLKYLKRSMYGRANVDLLRKKVMGCSLAA